MSTHATRSAVDDNDVMTSRPAPPNTQNTRRERIDIDITNKDQESISQHGEEQTQFTSTLRSTCADIHERVTRFLSAPSSNNDLLQSTQDQTRTAIKVISQALRDYDFDALSLSYNGGKDCLVLLIIYLSVLHTHFTQPSGRRKQQEDGSKDKDGDDSTDFPTSIPSIYAKPPDPFDSVTSFVDSSTRDYHLDLTHISTNPGPSTKSKSHSSPPATSHAELATMAATATATGMINGTSTTTATATTTTTEPQDPMNSNTDSTKPRITFRDAFALYLQTHPTVQAIFVGTRRTDPHGATLSHFQMTDGNWPRFMRIHPVIDWKLSEIWCFLRSDHLADPRTGRKLEYCEIYDMGYTSLGGVSDTLRNPRLSYRDESGQEKYRPAYELTRDEEERAGREK